MSLRDRVAAIPRDNGGKECGVSLQLAALKPRDQKELEELLLDRTVSVQILLRACREEGYMLINKSAIQKHRTRKCRCFGGAGGTGVK